MHGAVLAHDVHYIGTVVLGRAGNSVNPPNLQQKRMKNRIEVREQAARVQREAAVLWMVCASPWRTCGCPTV